MQLNHQYKYARGIVAITLTDMNAACCNEGKFEVMQQSHQLTLDAGNDMRAPASSASSLPKTGAPSPLGQCLTMHVTSPPHESPVFLMSSITAHANMDR